MPASATPVTSSTMKIFSNLHVSITISKPHFDRASIILGPFFDIPKMKLALYYQFAKGDRRA
jgi:hypothetical protein